MQYAFHLNIKVVGKKFIWEREEGALRLVKKSSLKHGGWEVYQVVENYNIKSLIKSLITACHMTKCLRSWE